MSNFKTNNKLVAIANQATIPTDQVYEFVEYYETRKYGTKYAVVFNITDKTRQRLTYETNLLTHYKEPNMMESVKEYLKEHKSIIITIAVALVVDHLVFGGAFREKVKSLVDGLLNKAQKQLDDK